MSPDLRVRFAVDDEMLSRLHARAFGGPYALQPWADRLARYSVAWVGAFHDRQLVGFVHACTDGGAHAFALDTVVDPDHQGQGLGTRLVQTLITAAREAGCHWLHVDYEPQLQHFYEGCGFGPTAAGLLRL